MKLIKVHRKGDDANHDDDGFYDWLQKKINESRRIYGEFAHCEIDFNKYSNELKLMVKAAGGYWFRSETSDFMQEARKCFNFYEQMSKECKSKFPDVVVSW